MSTVHYNNCPVCQSERIDPLIKIRDHSVSKEEFVIWQCRECSLRFTQDAPDKASIGRYYESPEYISHTNTNTGLINRLYQKVRRLTLQQKARLVIAHTVTQGRLLDYGAGIGAFMNTMKEKGWEVNGVEPDEGAREQAKRNFSLSPGSLEDLESFQAGRFDAITLWHVLEHVHDLHVTMERLKELLKPGGKLFVAVPNYNSVDNAIYKSYWAAYDVPRHLYHFTPPAIETLVKNHGMQLVSTRPMWYDSFYISLLSSKYKHGSSNWIGATVSGLRSNMSALLDKNRCSSLIYIIKKS